MQAARINLCHYEISLAEPSRPDYLPRTMRNALLVVIGVAVVACRPAVSPTPVPAPPPAREGLTALPPVPLVEGPLAPRVTYPPAEHLIQTRDSNFMLGSVGNGRASLTINGAPVRVWPNGAFLAFVANPTIEAPRYDLVASVGADTARMSLPIRLPGMIPPVPDSLKPPPVAITDTTPTWVVLGDSASVASDTDRVVIGRPGPNGVYRWFLLPGTRVQLTGRYPGYARIRLDSALEIWVDAADARTLATDTIAPRRAASNARVRSTPDYTDLIIPIAERPAFYVEEGERTLDLVLYDTRGGTDVINYPTADSLIRYIEWESERSDRVRYRIHLSQQPFGFLVLYENNSFVLRVRRAPGPVSGNVSPLSGLTIVVDPGHPPAGATGPTGFYEGDAVLPVGHMLAQMLRQRGANVVMTRLTKDTVPLALRSVIARRANGHAFVSLHYNAYGDGVNPLVQRNGMEVYYFRPHSEPLARAVQTEMLRKIPLADQGVYYRSLSVVRNSWVPAILVEGGFIIIPEQEYAMSTPAFQEAYARAVVDGLARYFEGIRRK